MNRTPCASPRLLSAALLFGLFALSSLSCTTLTSFWVTPTPTFTPTQTVTPTFTPSPTPKLVLPVEERKDYHVILRYVGEDVRVRFDAVREFLEAEGFQVNIDSGPSNVGNMNVILFGSPACNDAIDDLTILLKGKLDIQGLERMRFTSDDAYYEAKNLVIQINSIERFGPEL